MIEEMRNRVVKKVRKGVWGMGRVREGMKEVIRWDKVGVGGNKG